MRTETFLNGFDDFIQRTKIVMRAMDQSSEGFAIADADGTLLYANRTFAEMHGMESEDLIGKHASRFNSEEKSKGYTFVRKQLEETGCFKGEVQHKKMDGTLFPVLERNLLVQDEEGNGIGIVVTASEISEIDRLRESSEDRLRLYDRERSEQRLRWFRSHRPDKMFPGHDYLLKAYHVLLERLQSNEAECPVIHKDAGRLVFHSANFCPTLEACKILNLDTRKVCRVYNEISTDLLVKEIHPQLKFTRNYKKLRPYWGYCEEIIELEE